MKTLIAILLFAAALGAQELKPVAVAPPGSTDALILTPVPFEVTIGMFASLVVTAPAAGNIMRESRRDMQERCAEQKAECFLIVLEKDGKRLAEMDLDGVWHEHGARADIADVLFSSFSQYMKWPGQ